VALSIDVGLRNSNTAPIVTGGGRHARLGRAP